MGDLLERVRMGGALRRSDCKRIAAAQAHRVHESATPGYPCFTRQGRIRQRPREAAFAGCRRDGVAAVSPVAAGWADGAIRN